MNLTQLAVRGLVFNRRRHAGVLAGAALATAILVGALAVGDSVRDSLVQLAVIRLGRTEHALSAGERMFRAALAEDIGRSLDADTAAVLRLQAVVTARDGAARLNRVTVLGVDERFWALGETVPPLPGPSEVLVNRPLARRLGLVPGDELVLRLRKTGALPAETPLVPDAGTIALRVKVRAVAPETAMGLFSLRSSQVPTANVFVSRAWLAERLEVSGRANLVLAAGQPGEALPLDQLNAALADAWRLVDAGLRIDRLDDGALQLTSGRVFLDATVSEAALRASPSARGIFTYFVNRISCGETSTPYSFVCAPGPPLVAAGTDDDGIVLNSWLAEDLKAGVGDSVAMSYYVVGPRRELTETSAFLRVSSVVPLAGAAADRNLTPGFPGLADADNCRDWAPGIPLDLDAVRDRDETYWQQYRATPKAFVTLAAARRMWGNRFGDLTAVRYPAGDPDELADAILEHLAPGQAGLSFRPVRADGVRAGRESVDFGQLFLGMSFFLVAAAMLLTGLLFLFGIEQRAAQSGLLRAVGFPAATVRRLVMIEGGVLALIGGLAGAACGLLYNRAIVTGLSTLWRGATGTAALHPSVRLQTVLIGVLAGAGSAWAAMWLATRRQARAGIATLQQAGGAGTKDGRERRARPGTWAGAAGIVLAGLVLAWAGPGRGREAAAACFGAGSLLLMSGLLLCRALLVKAETRREARRLTLVNMGLRNCARRRGRSLAVIGILACGLFVVFAVGANRHGVPADTRNRKVGTGGFALYGETAVPVMEDLNSSAGRERHGLSDTPAERARFVQMRVRDGDDASCLNLNRVQQPRLLGVRACELAERGAFTFAETTAPLDGASAWLLLDRESADGTVPAIADEAVIVWGLGKKVGDTLEYRDEHGQVLTLRLVGGLANSVLQGSLVISERNFMQSFPSISGTRVFLVDAPPGPVAEISESLGRAMRDAGLELVPAAVRLEEFNAVENTYLSIFMALGGLGLVLGSAGLGIVMLRNVFERRGELALLRAVGYRRAALLGMLLVEHGVLLVAGLLCGTLSAIAAVLPALLAPGAGVPAGRLLLAAAGVAGSGLIWTLLAALAAQRGDLLAALRAE